MTREEVFPRWQAKVQLSDTPSECWQWTGAKDKDGRGKQRVEGQLFYATQLSWWLHECGPLNERHLFHTCDNPSCVNPNHLQTRETIWTKNELTEDEKAERFRIALRRIQNYLKHHWHGC
jgi:hypothetical protein